MKTQKTQPVSWINRHKKAWRVAVLIALLVAIMGPWTYTPDGAPPAEWCREPYFLLAQGRCVRSMSGAHILTFWPVALVEVSGQLARGTLALAERGREFFGVLLLTLLVFLLVQPFLSTPLLLLGGERRRRRRYHLLTWGLAALVSALSLPALSWGRPLTFWGNWLYAGLAVIALAAEVWAIHPAPG